MRRESRQKQDMVNITDPNLDANSVDSCSSDNGQDNGDQEGDLKQLQEEMAPKGVNLAKDFSSPQMGTDTVPFKANNLIF